MPYLGRSDSSGIALVISLESDWTFTLQRRDFAPDETLGQYFGKELNGQDLRRLLPNWSTVTWWLHSAGELLPAEWIADSDDYFLRLTPTSASDDTRAAIAAFLRLMNGP